MEEKNKQLDVSALADEIIVGRRLTEEDDPYRLVDADLDELCAGADRIRKALRGDKVDLCTIISGKEGKCSENCRYCAQSGAYHTNCPSHPLLDGSIILAQAKANQDEQVDRFCIVNSGYAPTPEDFEKLISIYSEMDRSLSIGMCASLGFLTAKQMRRLHEAGVTGLHCNIETSRRFFPHICTTHTFDDKIANIRRAQAEGFHVCSGGIIGMGETWRDRVDMALTLHELGIMSIPVNSLMPIPGTPLADMPRLSGDDILRTIAIFRYINPEADVRLAGGRALMADNGRRTFSAGASASITGNMLTTSGSTIRQDKEMLAQLGKDTVPEWTRVRKEAASA